MNEKWIKIQWIKILIKNNEKLNKWKQSIQN